MVICFKHASIDGAFTLDSGGRLEIKNIGLEDINSLIKLSKFSDKLKMRGNLKQFTLIGTERFIILMD